jgi:putative FmdB family regulatory protein
VPIYCYRCDNCGEESEVRHSMGDRLSDCQECAMDNSLVRIPQLTFKVEAKLKSEQVGSQVNQAIADNKQLLAEMKKEGRLNDFS